jgi:hypothetical protein
VTLLFRLPRIISKNQNWMGQVVIKNLKLHEILTLNVFFFSDSTTPAMTSIVLLLKWILAYLHCAQHATLTRAVKCPCTLTDRSLLRNSMYPTRQYIVGTYVSLELPLSRQIPRLSTSHVSTHYLVWTHR